MRDRDHWCGHHLVIFKRGRDFSVGLCVFSLTSHQCGSLEQEMQFGYDVLYLEASLEKMIVDLLSSIFLWSSLPPFRP